MIFMGILIRAFGPVSLFYFRKTAMEISDTTSRNTVFMNTDFSGKYMQNKTFVKCEFHNCNFSDSMWYNCSFIDCKAFGSSAANVVGVDVMLSLTNLDFKFNRPVFVSDQDPEMTISEDNVTVSNVRFTSASFLTDKLAQATFLRCTFDKVPFHLMHLKNVYFEDCVFNVGTSSLVFLSEDNVNTVHCIVNARV